MIGSNFYSVKRYSILTTKTPKNNPSSIQPTPTTATTIRRRRINLLPFVQVLLVLLLGTISNIIPTMAFSTSSRVFAFTIRNHGSVAISISSAHRMIGRTTSRSYSGLSSFSLSSSSNNNNVPPNESDNTTNDWMTTTTTTTTGPRTTTGSKFTPIPRRANDNNNSNKFFPNKINTRTYSTNGRMNDISNMISSSTLPQQQQQSFSTSSFEDDDLDAALDNVMTSSRSTKRSTPDGSFNPVRLHDDQFHSLCHFDCCCDISMSFNRMCDL